jgi:UDP-N-acetylmuramoyl-tripeptide--D-alanyl-D-alanine ligase
MKPAEKLDKKTRRDENKKKQEHKRVKIQEYENTGISRVSVFPRSHVPASLRLHASRYMLDLVDTLLVATHGKLLQGLTSGEIHGFSIDSRTLKPGQIFVALLGERLNGHDFMLQAVQKGTKGIIGSDKKAIDSLLKETHGQDFFVIQVEDTLQALQDLAHAHRIKYRHIPLIGVTGSNGKTTVKEMIASILNQRYTTLKTQGNLNNLIGLPLSLLNLTEAHGVGVLEMGMNKAGEIKRLAEIAEPDVGVITNISGAHLGFFDSLEAIMNAKMELVQSLPLQGIAILNADDTFFPSMAQEVRCKLITFGINWEAHVSASEINLSEKGNYTFTLRINGGRCPLTLPIIGYHNIYNALAAAAAAYALGLGLEEIKRGLESFQPAPMRMERLFHKGILILNDAYNANPSSMKMALKTLNEISGTGRKIAVLGDMLELGSWSEMAHKGIGEAVVGSGVDLLWVLGAFAPFVVSGAVENGMAKDQVLSAETHEQIIESLKQVLKEGDTVLVKGSRGMKMEKIVKGLLNE